MTRRPNALQHSPRRTDWGIDYMHLAKYDGRWMIVNVLWQSHPEGSTN